MKKLFLSLFSVALAANVMAQSKSDVFDASTPVTFIGLDFTQTKFIGNASNYKDAGEVTNASMKEKYIPNWNHMFASSSEKKNFKVADAINRSEVDYAIEVADKVNGNITRKDFFSDKMADFPHFTSSQIADMVKKYDFMGKSGIGLIFFVEGMRKGEEKGDPSYATVWVTFVDMKSKTVLLTQKVEGKAGGFGFRNFWAGAWKNVIKETKSEWRSWK